MVHFGCIFRRVSVTWEWNYMQRSGLPLSVLRACDDGHAHETQKVTGAYQIITPYLAYFTVIFVHNSPSRTNISPSHYCSGQEGSSSCEICVCRDMYEKEEKWVLKVAAKETHSACRISHEQHTEDGSRNGIPGPDRKRKDSASEERTEGPTQVLW